MSSIEGIWKSTFVNSWFFKRYNNISTFRSFISFKNITIFRIRDFISSNINVIMLRIRDFISYFSFKYRLFLFLNRKSVRNSKQSILFLNDEFFSLTMNDDKIFSRIIILIFNSNNFHLWIEKLKDLILKIKIWKYINSYDKIEESREEVLSKISHFVVKQSDFASSAAADDLITSQTD
jgi:hypothetical protein